MKSEIRKITPQIAAEMLKRNSGNRPITDRHVRFLVNEMKNGNWMFDGQPIRFSEGGTLLDGQHRLTAIIESDTTHEFLVVTGIAKEAFKVMDTGKNRTAGEVFTLDGVANGNDLAAATRIIINIKSDIYGRNSAHDRPSNSDILNFFHEHPSIKDNFNGVRVLYEGFNKVLTMSQIIAYRYLMAERHALQSETFWSKLCHGLGLEEGSPIKVLRHKLISDKLSKASLPTSEKVALIFKAWNFYREDNNDVKFLRWNRASEKFPVLK